MNEESVGRADIEALAATRAELGRDYEPDLLDAFADKVEQTIELRVAGHLAARERERRLASRLASQQLTLGVMSLVAAIPITLALALNGKMAALLVAWVGIVLVNLAHAALSRRAD